MRIQSGVNLQQHKQNYYRLRYKTSMGTGESKLVKKSMTY